jgi:hypothetical protein
MKSLYKFLICIMLIGLGGQSCNQDKFLEENPYTVFGVDYFKTPSGFRSGIYTLYSGLRYLYGPEGMVSLGSVGTDEWTLAEQARAGSPGFALTLGNYTLDAANGALLTPWNRSFNNINLANGLVGFAADVDMADAEKNVLIGEVRFLRAQYYILLVQQFGAVPLDLGSGDLQFNQSPFQGFNRTNLDALLAANYAAIIADLEAAAASLPDARPAGAFKVSRAAALHMLAKVHLQRAYSSAAQGNDYAKALEYSKEIIDNQGKYDVTLLPNFKDVFRDGNDYNKEIIFSIERVPGNFGANEIGTPNGIGAGKGTDAHNDFCGDYTAMRAPLASSSNTPLGTRAIPYGRPIRRFCPTPYAYFIAFADKINDSRYHGSFRTVYQATQASGPYVVGDTAMVLADTDEIADALNALTNDDGSRKLKYRVVAPREYYFIGGSIVSTVTRNFYPCISKFEDSKNLDPNNQATRPFPAARLAETYLIAAEAAMALNNKQQAMEYLNVIRTRAAFRPNLTPAEVAERAAAMQLTNSAVVTLDFILEERTREMMGECTRWPDLATRGKLLERTIMYNSDAAPNIKAHHVLRPIPREQLDRINDTNKALYQNPGY